MRTIKKALISVFHKDGINKIAKKLHELDIEIISTGGTLTYIESLGIPVTSVDSLTSYPAIFSGRVKTLHPVIFGGILNRRDNENDTQEKASYQIPDIDLVIVDLYPFEKTVESTNEESAIIEKIDIGGISLIRAAAKNYKDVLVVPSVEQYDQLYTLLEEKSGTTSKEDRKYFAAQAFNISSHYDTAIFNFFNADKEIINYKDSYINPIELRYGENPHQKGYFCGDISKVFDQLHGKAISYNNLLDIDGAVNLIKEFDETTFAILKHNNACGLACRENLLEAWKLALGGDPISAFGGVLITNAKVDETTAEEIHKLFFEIIIAPAYSEKALEILKQKKNRIILQKKSYDFSNYQVRTALNGVLYQQKDFKTETPNDLVDVCNTKATDAQKIDLIFANKVVKNTKSNAIVLAKDKVLLASGTGQTSRVDALNQAIDKAKHFEQILEGSVMASDAFFPFPDCVEIGFDAGVRAVIQPGGSIRDNLSVDFCNDHKMVMLTTGTRHFRH